MIWTHPILPLSLYLTFVTLKDDFV
ncbi:hypothetical protein ACHAWO_000666 [Cyclotella atomus]|uniref:Uncharacterized protein n=1 Tax=Cyclotella atomus TaxID=382360 RepID=A0ABD3QD95_9STRA